MDIEQIQDEMLEYHGSGLNDGYDAGHAAGYKAAMKKTAKNIERVLLDDGEHISKFLGPDWFRKLIQRIFADADYISRSKRRKFAGHTLAKRDFLETEQLSR